MIKLFMNGSCMDGIDGCNFKGKRKGKDGQYSSLPIGMMIRHQGFNEETRNTSLKSLQ
jgi:hypothetical protein